MINRELDIIFQHGYDNGDFTLIQDRHLVKYHTDHFRGQINTHCEPQATLLFDSIKENPELVHYLRWQS